jgi:hypothetical protein
MRNSTVQKIGTTNSVVVGVARIETGQFHPNVTGVFGLPASGRYPCITSWMVDRVVQVSIEKSATVVLALIWQAAPQDEQTLRTAGYNCSGI